MACETAGVGVYSSFAASISSTWFAASTSTALFIAGRESACVSMPRKSGPSIFCCLRYKQIAWVIARMCHSLKDRSKDEPRCPDVPKATRCSGTLGSGFSAKYAAINFCTSTRSAAVASCPALGLILFKALLPHASLVQAVDAVPIVSQRPASVSTQCAFLTLQYSGAFWPPAYDEEARWYCCLPSASNVGSRETS